jgi:peptidoglycan/LPS O-acetylase OafA/YrhL
MGLSTNVLADAPAHRSPSTRFYRPELDGLRFYAFAGVFVCHTLPLDDASYRALHLPAPWLWLAVVRAGMSGVDLFFALSAFLITSLLLKERRETGRVSLRLFYLRRILRIWPLYFLVVALGVVLALAVPKLQPLPWRLVAGYVLFVSNWMYPFFAPVRSICAPLWTVSIEEQFYLLWPALLKVLQRRGIVVAAITTIVLATLSQVGIVLTGVGWGYLYYGSASRATSFAMGILLACGADRLPKLTSGFRFMLVTGGIGGWIFAAARLNDQPGAPGMHVVLGRLIISFASAAILYGCLYSSNKLLGGGAVVRLGKISYGLYMWHFTGLFIAYCLTGLVHGWQRSGSVALGFVMTLLLAFASYRWVESPFLRLKDRFTTVFSRPV